MEREQGRSYESSGGLKTTLEHGEAVVGRRPLYKYGLGGFFGVVRSNILEALNLAPHHQELFWRDADGVLFHVGFSEDGVTNDPRLAKDTIKFSSYRFGQPFVARRPVEAFLHTPAPLFHADRFNIFWWNCQVYMDHVLPELR